MADTTKEGDRLEAENLEGNTPSRTPQTGSPTLLDLEQAKSEQKITMAAVLLGLVASVGGFMFGYVSGQISGFFAMADFNTRFGDGFDENGEKSFSAVRQGTIVGMLSIGCLFGCLLAGKLADMIGRRLTISIFAFFSCIGIAVETSSSYNWAQFAGGRLLNGIGIGALSVVSPMYQSESSPAIIRGIIISTYQLLVTLGILIAEIVNYKTSTMAGSPSWRIPSGLSLAWALTLGVGILFLPESPRYAFSKGREEEARQTIAKLAGVAPDSTSVNLQIEEIRQKMEEDNQGEGVKWHHVFTGPRMKYRMFLGIALQTGQQLTGANFFFYFGTTVFRSTGLDNSFITQLILGAVNVICTFGGLYVVKKVSRRKALIAGALWMMICFLIYAFVGHFALDQRNPLNSPAAGNVLVIFSCLFIAAFASTWGPLVWAVVAELYPARYRSTAMSIATAFNWLFNFLMSFSTRFITDRIDYLYGLVFAGCCGALAVIVYFFMIESKDRGLEEIDTMYRQQVPPRHSRAWQPDSGPEVKHRRPSAEGETVVASSGSDEPRSSVV